VTYRCLTTGELIDELESYSAQITALALQMDKLVRLKSEAKISDLIYAELYQDIGKKVYSARRDRNDLADAARARMKEINSELAELKYRLERLEVRRMLDFISAEKYSAAKEELMKKMGDNDEVVSMIGKLVSSTEEAFGRIDSCMPAAKQAAVQGAIENEVDAVQGQEPQGAVVVEPVAVEEPEIIPMPEVEEPVARAILPKPVRQEPLRPVDEEPNIEAMAEQEPLSDELICPRCQTGNPQDAVFCFACGSKLVTPKKKVGPTLIRNEVRREEPAKVAIQPEVKRKKHANKYVPKDSNDITVKKCPKCGMENLSIAAYCYQCNTSLAGNGTQDVATETQRVWMGRP